jgi:hypothetical protein
MKEKEKGHTVANGVRREVYPKPEHRFSNANIGMTFRESEPDFLPLDKAPPRAPNVVVVLLDDVGYGSPSPYGGLVRMPAAGRLAQQGITYCELHATVLCAPPRTRSYRAVRTDTGGSLPDAITTQSRLALFRRSRRAFPAEVVERHWQDY